MPEDAASRDQENKRRESVRKVFAQLLSDESGFSSKFAERVKTLRKFPFVAGEAAALNLSQASACEREDTSRFKWLTFASVVPLALAILLFVEFHLPRWKRLTQLKPQTDKVWTLKSLGDFFTSLLSPPDVPWVVMPEVLLLLAALGLLAYGVLRWRKPPPLHEPDPLFDRMLQEHFPLPVSRYTYTEILCDPRFRTVLADALNTVFPFDLGGEQPAGVTEEREKFIERLIEHLGPNGRCARFLLGHSVEALKQRKDKELSRYLDEEMREMVFAEILDDPAFAYIYHRNQPRWRQIFAWLTALDFEKAMKLFRPGEPKKEKPDKMQAALIGLALILIVLLAEGVYGKKECPECKSPARLSLERSEQLEELTRALKALVEKLKPGEQASPGSSPIEVNVLPAAAPSVTVPISMPGPSEPPRTNVSVQAPSKAGGGGASQTTGETKLSGGPISIINQNIPAAIGPQDVVKPEATTGGDDFIKLEYRRRQAQEKGTDSDFAWRSATLTLHTASGSACVFTVSVADDSPWPPDPVLLKVLSADTGNRAECRGTGEVQNQNQDGAAGLGKADTFAATAKPSYSSLLHAYVSVEAYHRRHLPPFRKNYMVLRVHYEAAPKD